MEHLILKLNDRRAQEPQDGPAPRGVTGNRR